MSYYFVASEHEATGVLEVCEVLPKNPWHSVEQIVNILAKTFPEAIYFEVEEVERIPEGYQIYWARNNGVIQQVILENLYWPALDTDILFYAKPAYEPLP